MVVVVGFLVVCRQIEKEPEPFLFEVLGDGKNHRS